MIEHVSSGGQWTIEYLQVYCKKEKLKKPSPLIQIREFEDGRRYIHDGHHRCVATWLGGRRTLFPEEYVLTACTYDYYWEVNHGNGWYTPFDPRRHQRLADFDVFKQEARQKFVDDPDNAEKWCWDNWPRYRIECRNVILPEMALSLRLP